jgi:Leucine-rich repeat (LRR) protein
MQFLTLIKYSGIGIILSACSFHPYSISMNNNVLFRPKNTSALETFSDSALQACANNYLNENPGENLASLTLLSCTDAGITSLVGLNQLPSLSIIDLSNNDIDDLSPMINLTNLRVLRIANNHIKDISILNELSLLNFIDLSGNDNISCRQLDRLQERIGNSLLRPLSCI